MSPIDPRTLSANEPPRTVAEDTPCRICGYNLRGLAADAVCPECGAELAGGAAR